MRSINRRFLLPLLLTLVLVLVLPSVTYARLLCRSDPKVSLTNGVQMDIGASINSDISNIIVVNYELHVPVGVGLARREHTLGWSDVNETFTLIADQPANSYYTRVTVRARTGNPTFTSYTNVKFQGQTLYQTAGTANRSTITSFTSNSR